jgi:NAD(P)-dependent dehydrogenase (short-subunit alcohol dehydrogenase family)
MTPRVRQDGAGRTALVTGCSSGIGRAVARRLRDRGMTVYGAARNAEDLTALAEEGLRPVPLDLTDDASVAAAVRQVSEAAGGIDVLVNNAGIGIAGGVLAAPAEEVRGQFEVNVFGPLRLTQLVAAAMVARGSGTIVNVSSVAGRFGMPGSGAYSASKHAVEGLSDALRAELRRYGVRVVVVEPAVVRTRFGAKAAGADLDGADAAGGGGGNDDAYARAITDWYAGTYGPTPRTPAGRFASTPEDVARVVCRAALASRPRARYPVGVLAKGLLALRRWAPDAAFDAFVRRQFPVPPAGAPQAVAPSAGVPPVSW